MKLNASLDIRTHRSLSMNEKKNELRNANFQNKTRADGGNYKLLNIRNNNNTYEQLKQERTHNMESYLKSYKNRYAKKVGLKKLDCYYEKKFFKSLDKIEKLAKQNNFSNSRIKKMLYTKYGLPLFLLSLVPLIALALPVYVVKVHKKGLDKCEFTFDAKKQNTVTGVDHKNCVPKLVDNYSLKYIYLIISIIIIVSLIIYTYIKVQKYKRIKDGMLK
ncbi:hypothetical protein PVMG_05951 [Plasmodium vivax Mauritania I]|uniref:Variable surface protein Vir35 n=1 Tax=Plasmodium vivax Mauritania I TaxID=1035515 RepID=A0A0J9TK30_PLAVI|nr:hypothetical protein PVMG_05951 [Plasmodium vivax Mauritania I]